MSYIEIPLSLLRDQVPIRLIPTSHRNDRHSMSNLRIDGLNERRVHLQPDGLGLLVILGPTVHRVDNVLSEVPSKGIRIED